MRCPHVTSCYWGEAQLKRTATACCAIASYDVPPNIDEVREDIVSATTTTPTPNPSPQGGGERTAFVARPNINEMTRCHPCNACRHRLC
jgi:hypothetical protein